MNLACRGISLLALGSLLAACAVGPDYQAPSTSTPATFAGQPGIDQRRAGAAAPLDAWWQGFDDPVLARLVVQALDHNLDLAQAEARVTQSRAALRSATASLLPSGDVSGEAERTRISLQSPEGRLLNATPGFDRTGNYFEADLGASWEVDVFGGLRRDREAAQALYQASQADVVAVRLMVAAQTADTYVRLRGLQERLAIATRQAEVQRRLLHTVTLQFNAGVAAELQLRQAEGALSQVEARIPVLQAALDATLYALDVMLGEQPGSNRALLDQPAPIPGAPAIANAGGPAELLRRRPDLIVAERRLAASNALIGSAIAEYYPKFSLSGLVGTATTASGSLFHSGADQTLGVAGLRWRLFDFGRVEAEIASAKGSHAGALAAYRLSVLRASEDVEDAFSSLVRREAEEATLAAGEQSLTRARDVSLVAYKGGVVSLIEVLDADDRLLQTRDARAQARTEAALAAIASFRALGGGWNAGDFAQS